jgi:hypothetical protein
METISPLTLERLSDRIAALIASGAMAPIAGSAVLRAGSLISVTARLDRGVYTQTVDSVSVKRIACAGVEGLGIALAAGNFKDDACCIASAAIALAFYECFDSPTIFEPDIPTLLRRGMLTANDYVLQLALAPLGDWRPGTAVGARASLKGIAAAATVAVALPHRAWIAHIGDNRGFLVRGQDARRLTVDHTLVFEGAYSAAVEPDPSSRFDRADQAVLRVLGLCAMPQFDVTRIDLLPGDRLLLGNAGLSKTLAASLDTTRVPIAADAVVAAFQELSSCRTGAPPTLAVIDVPT